MILSLQRSYFNRFFILSNIADDEGFSFYSWMIWRHVLVAMPCYSTVSRSEGLSRNSKETYRTLCDSLFLALNQFGCRTLACMKAFFCNLSGSSVGVKYGFYWRRLISSTYINLILQTELTINGNGKWSVMNLCLIRQI